MYALCFRAVGSTVRELCDLGERLSGARQEHEQRRAGYRNRQIWPSPRVRVAEAFDVCLPRPVAITSCIVHTGCLLRIRLSCELRLKAIYEEEWQYPNPREADQMSPYER